MREIEFWIVDAADPTYHHTPDEGNNDNDHRLGLPIAAGPFEDEETAADNRTKFHSEGQLVVALPKGKVPEDWDED